MGGVCVTHILGKRMLSAPPDRPSSYSCHTNSIPGKFIKFEKMSLHYYMYEVWTSKFFCYKYFLDMNIKAVVDATHPYASEITALAASVSSLCRIPYYRYNRPAGIYKSTDVFFAKDHEATAATAFSFGNNVLLTTGSKILAPYTKKSRQTDVRLVARVLDTEDSIRACLDAGIDRVSIVAGKGPFSVEDNIAVIRKFDIGVLVTKDGGVRGGVLEKLEAARAENCRIVVVERAESAEIKDRTWTEIGKLLSTLKSELRNSEPL